MAANITIVAKIDRCMEQLSLYTDEADLDLVCRPLRSGHEASLTRADLGNPHGFIVFGNWLAPLASQLQDEGARAVLVATSPYGIIPEVTCVHGAQGRGGYLAAKHLLELGHRRLAFLQDGLHHSMNPRWHGILKAIRDAGKAGVHASVIPLPKEEMEAWRDTPAKGAAWVRRPGAPTGVLAWNDEHAIRLLSTLTLAGVKVPDEISVMGYDALPERQQSHPPLTTVKQFLRSLSASQQPRRRW
jgi:DNA-binding LacI/PurR family transcriptional regulator